MHLASSAYDRLLRVKKRYDPHDVFPPICLTSRIGDQVRRGGSLNPIVRVGETVRGIVTWGLRSRRAAAACEAAVRRYPS
jgi:Berberine and berberine like